MENAVGRDRQWTGTPYSLQDVVDLCGAVEQAFGRDWLDARMRKPDPFRLAWQTTNQQSTVLLCRAGRDIRRLWRRGDPAQDAHLAGMIEKQIKPSPDAAMHFLYELHIATLFDDRDGVSGKLAPPGAAGYDLTLEMPEGRTLWVSCKRAKTSKGENVFRSRANEIYPRLVDMASRHGLHAFGGLVATDPPLIAHDPDTIARAWEEVCAAHSRDPGTVATASPSPLSMIAMAPGWTANLPLRDRSTIIKAPYIQFISAMSPQEHERIHDVFTQAARKFRHKSVPEPTARDIRIIALDVTEYTLIGAVARLLHKELVAGHYRDVSAILLSRALDAGTMGPQPLRTVAEEYYLLVNAGAHVPLWEFLRGETLTILVEGFHLYDGPPRIVIPHPDTPVHMPDGYIYNKWDLSYRMNEHGYLNFYMPPMPPAILLPLGITITPYTETLLPMALHPLAAPGAVHDVSIRDAGSDDGAVSTASDGIR